MNSCPEISKEMFVVALQGNANPPPALLAPGIAPMRACISEAGIPIAFSLVFIRAVKVELVLLESTTIVPSILRVALISQNPLAVAFAWVTRVVLPMKASGFPKITSPLCEDVLVIGGSLKLSTGAEIAP